MCLVRFFLEAARIPRPPSRGQREPGDPNGSNLENPGRDQVGQSLSRCQDIVVKDQEKGFHD
jgi:hypothetical protein